MFRTVLGYATYLVESIPWLKYLPWYGQELKRGYESSKRIHTSQLNRVKQQMVRIALPLTIFLYCLNRSAEEQCGFRPFIREICVGK